MTRGVTVTLRSILFAAAALTIAGCGGGMGGGGGGGGQPQMNRPPAFTSAATVSVPENSTGTIYTATATDPDGNPLTFSLSGGADRTDFSISAAGALSFVATPDFEAPADADGNNIYLVQISVSDGMTSAVLDLAVTVTNGGSDAFAVRRVGVGFAQPLFVAPVPDGSGRVFVVEKAGRIRILNPQTGAINALPFLDIRGAISTDSERGLLGLATAPDFATTGTFYVHLTNLAGDIEIRRYQTLAGNRDLANPATADVILVVRAPEFLEPQWRLDRLRPGRQSLHFHRRRRQRRRPARKRPEPQRAARQDPPDQRGQRRLPGRSQPRLCDSRHESVRARRRIARNLGPWRCAIRSAPASTLSPRICGSAMSAREAGKRST